MSIPKAKIVTLSDAERQGLEKLIKRHQVGQQIAMRARIVLAGADGYKNKEIVQKYQVTADTVRLWCNRWIELQDISLDDLSIEDRLQDAPRPGAPAKITADQRCRIEALLTFIKTGNRYLFAGLHAGWRWRGRSLGFVKK